MSWPCVFVLSKIVCVLRVVSDVGTQERRQGHGCSRAAHHVGVGSTPSGLILVGSAGASDFVAAAGAEAFRDAEWRYRVF
ncbi:hypothetical protein KC19_4G151700 [Ceratodon purpureus]|uniref:Secreted protein n=1 Tax=Ceratodon purpureus TaxID=3225 RepID=A0A8T0I932_CERPU|nr:hypothetical protein KC19_4G151700 [Ceratodon purpureus]